MAGTAVPRVRKAQRKVRFAIAGLIVAACVAWLAVRRAGVASPVMSTCEAIFRAGDYQRALGSCLVSSVATRDSKQLALAANAAMQTRDLPFAQLLASRLQYTPWFADAQHILAYVELNDGDLAAASRHAGLALLAHELAGNERALAGDAALVSEVALKQGDFAASIAAGDEAVRLAQLLHDRRLEGSVKRIRAMALRRVGEWDRAIADLRDAVEAATDACSAAWNEFELAVAYEDRIERLGDAGRLIAEAAKHGRQCGKTFADTLSFHVAWVERVSNPEDARARLDALLPSHDGDAEAWLLNGYLHAGAGALADARRDLARADELEPPDADWPWLIAQSRAELAEGDGAVFGPILAEFHYRRAMGMVAALRATASRSAAYLVASHRGPYDGLIALLARQRRWREVLALVLELDGSDMLRATANAIGHRDSAAGDSMVLPAMPATVVRASTSARPSIDAVLAAWKPRDLVIVIAPSQREIGPGHERAYRLRIKDGDVTGEDIGAASEALRLAAALSTDPGDRVAGTALGAMLIPAGPERETLEVLAIGALGRAPLAALRDGDGRLVAARRPLARVLGVYANAPESRGGVRAVVVADPTGGLPNAALEGALVARALEPGAVLAANRFGSRDGGQTVVLADATRELPVAALAGVLVTGTLGSRRLPSGVAPVVADRDLLWSARSADLLHVAAHISAVGRWRALMLADGPVEPAEMLHRGLAPRLAVLASCGSAAATDEEGWGSIAAALLEAGTATVIATDRSINDADALPVTLGFYDQPDWRSDPAAALARVQAALDAQAAADDPARQTWAAFSVLRRPPVVAPPPVAAP